MVLDKNKDELNEKVVRDKVYLTNRAKYMKLLSDRHYWKRRGNEYLLGLRNVHTQNGENDKNINVGEVVVINEQLKRSRRLGVITKLIEGGD